MLKKTVLYPTLVLGALASVGIMLWQRQPEPPPPLASGHIALPEISGVGALGDDLLLAADDPEDKDDAVKKFHMIVRIRDAARGIHTGGDFVVSEKMQLYPELLQKLFPKTAKKDLDADTVTDLEDAAVSPEGDAFLTTSHSLSKKGKRGLKRTHLIHLKVDYISGHITQASMDDGSLLSHLPAEPKDLAASLNRKPGDADPGFNIEGLAWAPKADLLLGLRSPLVDNKAIVLRLPNAATWITKPATPMKLSVEQELDLGGRGIRGMCYDEKQKGYWLIAGMAADPEEGTSTKPNDWSLYFWDGKSTVKKVWDRAQDPVTKALDAPEAICLVPRGDRRALLLVSDDKPASSYVVIPEEQLGAH